MAEDPRESRSPKSGWAQFESGDSGTSKDVVSLKDEETLALSDYVVSYSTGGSANATVELYDDGAGTAEADLEGQITSLEVSPGNVESLTGISRDDIDKDLVAVVRNNDGNVSINAGGHIVTG
jgi:hypothetical protein